MDAGMARDIVTFTISSAAVVGISILGRTMLRAMKMLERMARSEDLLFHVAKAQRTVQGGLLEVITCITEKKCNGTLEQTVREIKESRDDISDYLMRSTFGRRSGEERRVDED
jgi:hypothetical protein